jgi:hypothetical protein
MSDSNSSSSRSGGIGFAGLLTILFIGLKLGHVITWPWIWVLSPLWISVALFFVIVVAAVVIGAIVAALR